MTEKECVYGKDSQCKFEESGKCSNPNPCVHIDCCSWELKGESK